MLGESDVGLKKSLRVVKGIKGFQVISDILELPNVSGPASISVDPLVMHASQPSDRDYVRDPKMWMAGEE